MSKKTSSKNKSPKKKTHQLSQPPNQHPRRNRPQHPLRNRPQHPRRNRPQHPLRNRPQHPHRSQLRLPHRSQPRLPHRSQPRLPHRNQLRLPHRNRLRLPHRNRLRNPCLILFHPLRPENRSFPNLKKKFPCRTISKRPMTASKQSTRISNGSSTVALMESWPVFKKNGSTSAMKTSRNWKPIFPKSSSPN